MTGARPPPPAHSDPAHPRRGILADMTRCLRYVTCVVALAVLAGACSDDDAAAPEPGIEEADASSTSSTTAAGDEASDLPDAYAGHESEVYAEDGHWLCKPGIAENVCQRDLDATLVFADGSTELQPHEPASDPPIDCFYVYPTTSTDESPNSDLVPAEADEIFTAYNQAARYTAACRVFAPVYRQRTLTALLGSVEVPDDVDPGEIAYADVVDAFRHYMANDNDGRGVVLIGHSQGAGLLRRLLAEEIEPEPALVDRLVSAHLLGTTVAVPEGETVGGSLSEIPLCTSAEQTGCVVTYSSFRESAPPPENSLFGRAREAGQRAGCVNPADPALEDGEHATLEPYFLVETVEGALSSGAQPFADPARESEIDTPWVSYPDFVSAACVEDDQSSYLSLAVDGDPADPRTDDIGGDLTPQWGMHLVDVSVAMGVLVSLARSQGEAYAAEGPGA